MIDKTSSYTAANTFPVKVLKHKDVPDRFGKIPPIHIQLNPTNVCNLDCEPCSCAKRNKKLEVDFEKLKVLMYDFALMGCRSITITGGGEPLLYSKINELIDCLFGLNIQIGLVTNGTQFEKLNYISLKKIKWIRISHMDYRPFNFKYRGYLTKYMFDTDMIDWAFSYVISDKPNFDNICQVVNYANTKSFTHVRIVSDLLDLKHIPDMDLIKESLNYAGIPDDLVIYQGRKEFVHGREKCLISLLKPVIGADGKLYPCCGSQYSMNPPSEDYDKSMCMGPAENFYEIYQKQKHFDGSQCIRCYYDDYNKLLELKTAQVEHTEFV